MPLNRVECPSCGAGLKSAAGFTAGQKIRCPKCKEAFAVPEPEFEEVEDEAPPPPAPKKKPIRAVAAVADDDEDEDDRPVKGKKKKKKKGGGGSYKTSPVRFIVLGLLLVVLGVLGYFLFLKNKKEKEDNNKPNATEKEDEDLAKPIKPKAKPTAMTPEEAQKAAIANMKSISDGVFKFAQSSADGGSLPRNFVNFRSKKQEVFWSWRVEILGFMNEKALYDEFKQDEPWDGPHNSKLIARMPAVFRSPKSPAPDGHTYYKGFAGKDAVLNSASPANLNRLTDGTTNTILIAEGGKAVPWTKPDDFPFDPVDPLPTSRRPAAAMRRYFSCATGAYWP